MEHSVTTHFLDEVYYIVKNLICQGSIVLMNTIVDRAAVWEGEVMDVMPSIVFAVLLL